MKKEIDEIVKILTDFAINKGFGKMLIKDKLAFSSRLFSYSVKLIKINNNLYDYFKSLGMEVTDYIHLILLNKFGVIIMMLFLI